MGDVVRVFLEDRLSDGEAETLDSVRLRRDELSNDGR
jgi:hypothetical protein